MPGKGNETEVYDLGDETPRQFSKNKMIFSDPKIFVFPKQMVWGLNGNGGQRTPKPEWPDGPYSKDNVAGILHRGITGSGLRSRRTQGAVIPLQWTHEILDRLQCHIGSLKHGV